MKRHGIKREDVEGRLFVVAKGELKMRLASQLRSGQVKRDDEAINGLIAYARRHEIDVISVDPFVRTHGVSENDNEAISAVVECFEDVAEMADCAVSLWHHTRKANGDGDGLSVESARGAKAFTDSCRSVRVLEEMSRKEAKRLGIANCGFYFREFSGKRNYAPPTEESTWYEKANVELENAALATDGSTRWFGDQVGVAVKWQHAGKEPTDLSMEAIAAVKEKVAAGAWREDVRAAMWVGKAVAQVLGLDAQDKTDRARIQGVIKELKTRGILKDETRWDAKRGQDFIFTVVA